MKKRVAILISGRGSNMAALIDAAKDPAYPAEIVLVLSNIADAGGLERAREAGVATEVVEHKPFGKDRAAFDRDAGFACAPKPARIRDVGEHQHDFGWVGRVFRGVDQCRHVGAAPRDQDRDALLHAAR